MDKEGAESGIQPFSYDILDHEAAKISNLIQAVNQMCSRPHLGEVVKELVVWAEQLFTDGKAAEADFLYLHAINLSPKDMITYPLVFTSLREYALALVQEESQSADNVTVMPTVQSVEATAA